MKIHTLRRRQTIHRELKEIFSFFSQPENLALITPKQLGFQMLTPLPVKMREGALIDYIIKVNGWPLRWTTMIADFESPNRFIDIQLRGPYSFWHHTHTFAETDDGTLITDDIRYALPLGSLGEIAQKLFVQRQLDRIFSYRSKIIEETFSIHDLQKNDKTDVIDGITGHPF